MAQTRAEIRVLTFFIADALTTKCTRKHLARNAGTTVKARWPNQ
jgi:hypothetical protein